MSHRDNIEKAVGDALYDAWRRGLNPDVVNVDNIEETYFESYDVEDAARTEVDRLEARQRERETQEPQ